MSSIHESSFIVLIHTSSITQGTKTYIECMSLGEVPFPGFAAYGSSKAALISYSGALRQEVSRWGIKVAIIQPAGFKTSEY